jgi:hypothetical protein
VRTTRHGHAGIVRIYLCYGGHTHLRQKRISRERSSAKSPALALPYRLRTQLLYVHCRERIVAIKTFLSCLLSVSIQNQFIQPFFLQHALPPSQPRWWRLGFQSLHKHAGRASSILICLEVHVDPGRFACLLQDVTLLTWTSIRFLVVVKMYVSDFPIHCT